MNLYIYLRYYNIVQDNSFEEQKFEENQGDEAIPVQETIKIEHEGGLLTVETLSKIIETVVKEIMTTFESLTIAYKISTVMQSKLICLEKSHIKDLGEHVQNRNDYNSKVDELINKELNPKLMELGLLDYFRDRVEENKILQTNLLQTLK